MPQTHVEGSRGRYPIGTFETPVNANCPIDQTQLLIPQAGYENRGPTLHVCRACNASYESLVPEHLRIQAQRYVAGKVKMREELQDKLISLDVLLTHAREAGFTLSSSPTPKP